MTTTENISAYVFSRAGDDLLAGWMRWFVPLLFIVFLVLLIDCLSLGFRALQTGEKGLQPLVSPTPGSDHS